MNALTFIIFGLIGYWIYWSVKHEGIFWIPRTASALGGFALWMYLIFQQGSQINNNFLQIVFIAGTGIFIGFISYLIVESCNEMIEKRVGKNPYKNPYVQLELEKKYYKELEETLTDEELKVGREFAESAEKKIREKIKKNGDISKNDLDDILNELKEGENK